jgi:GNAT superfamily N-acetyltransferase
VQVAAVFREVLAEGESYDFPADAGDEQIRGFWFPSTGWPFVFEECCRVAGAAVIRPLEGDASAATAAFIVAPANRGRGIGRTLGEFALQRASLLGFSAMQFNFVIATNRPAVHLWEQLGFAVTARHVAAFAHPRHGQVDALVMRCEIAA